MAHNSDVGFISSEGARPPDGFPGNQVIPIGSGDKYGDPKWRRAGTAQLSGGFTPDGHVRMTTTAVIDSSLESEGGIPMGNGVQAAAALSQSPYLQQHLADHGVATAPAPDAIEQPTQPNRPPRLRFEPGAVEGTGRLVPVERPLRPASPQNGAPAVSSPYVSAPGPATAEPPHRRMQQAPRLPWLDENGFPLAPSKEVLFKYGKSITRTYYHHVFVGERSVTLLFDQLAKSTMHMPAPPEPGEVDEVLLGVEGSTYRLFNTGMMHDDGRLLLLIFLRPPEAPAEPEAEEGPSFTDSHSPTVQT